MSNEEEGDYLTITESACTGVFRENGPCGFNFDYRYRPPNQGPDI